MRFVITQSGFDNNCLKLGGVIMTIKAKEWSNFIHKRAPKFVCPVCGHDQWQIQSGNKSEMLTINVKSPMNQICEALGNIDRWCDWMRTEYPISYARVHPDTPWVYAHGVFLERHASRTQHESCFARV